MLKNRDLYLKRMVEKNKIGNFFERGPTIKKKVLQKIL